jgi:hypothetical protein
LTGKHTDVEQADVTDVTKEGSSEFLFKVNGHKHTFQAASATERDSWVVAIEAKAAEAKAEKETITSGEGYKAELEKLSKFRLFVKTSRDHSLILSSQACRRRARQEAR